MTIKQISEQAQRLGKDSAVWAGSNPASSFTVEIEARESKQPIIGNRPCLRRGSTASLLHASTTGTRRRVR